MIVPQARVVMRWPSLLDRIWYRRINQVPPLRVGGTVARSARWARLLPYRWRRVHHAYAVSHSFFWLPCPLCGNNFGGHEAGKDIPDPVGGPHHFVMICSRCSRERP